MKKRLLSMILALGMMLTILPVNAITAWAENRKIIQSGNCGNNVTYDLTQNNDDTTNPTYTLTIKGNGEMADFKESDMEGRAPWIAQKEKITAVTIENGVTYVGAYAFDHCKKLTQITIHAQLDSIGEGAFRDCEGLTSIEIPKTVTSIGASAFSRCKGLSNIEIPETVVSIGGAAFNGCTGLTSIKIPATVTSIKEYTFNECSNLKNVEIPQGVVSIGECAFSGCGILESIEIPQNVTSIGEYAFFGCKTLTSIKIPAKVTSISKGILSGCSKLEDVEILGAVTSIGDNAFMSCGKLTDIKIPETVTSIGKNAFYMSGLTSIKIPDTVTSIGEYAFYGCNSLAKIEMPANMPNILQNTFYRTATTGDETRVFYYPGYRHNWNQQVSKISANGNTDLLANDYERVHYYCDVIFDSNGGTFTDVTDGSNTKTIKEVWRKEHLTQEQINSVGKPTKDGKMFIGWNTTRDATTVIDPKSDYIADDKIYYAVYKDAVPAAVTITDLDGTTVKAGEAKEFTVNVTPNDDANTGAKATITVSGANADAVEKIQYKDGETWKDVPDEGLSIDKINNTEFKLITKADANDGDVTITVTANKADGTEVARKDANFTVTKKEEPVTPGGGSTGGGENPGENPGGDSGNTNPTPKPDEKPDRKIKIDGGIVEVNGKEVKPDEDGNITVKKGDEITITVDKSKISDAQVFDQWVIKPDSVLNEVDPKSEKISFTMPAEDVTIEAMTRDASIEDDGPGILGTGALIATGVVGSAALLYQGHMLGTELYLRYLLPHGAVIPQNRAELAVLLWQDAENPEPVSTTLYSDISDEDSAIQQAARWAVENDLMEQLDAEEHPDHFDPFVPVTFSDSIRAWKKAQELKKSVH